MDVSHLNDRFSLDPRRKYLHSVLQRVLRTTLLASSYPFPELTGVPQSCSHLENVISIYSNIILFMCCFCLLTQLSRLVHFLSFVHCSAFIIQLSGLVHFLIDSSYFVRLSLGCTFPLLLCQAKSWHPSGSQGCPSEVLSIGVSTPRFSPCLSICCILMFPGLVFCPMPALMWWTNTHWTLYMFIHFKIQPTIIII